MFPAKGAETSYKALASIDDKIGAAKLDLNKVYTNDFVKKANTGGGNKRAQELRTRRWQAAWAHRRRARLRSTCNA